MASQKTTEEYRSSSKPTAYKYTLAEGGEEMMDDMIDI